MVSNKMTTQQLTPFEVGQVKADVEHGLSALAISQKVCKAGVDLETDTLPQHFEAVREKNTDQTNEIWNDCSQPP